MMRDFLKGETDFYIQPFGNPYSSGEYLSKSSMPVAYVIETDYLETCRQVYSLREALDDGLNGWMLFERKSDKIYISYAELSRKVRGAMNKSSELGTDHFFVVNRGMKRINFKIKRDMEKIVSPNRFNVFWTRVKTFFSTGGLDMLISFAILAAVIKLYYMYI